MDFFIHIHLTFETESWGFKDVSDLMLHMRDVKSKHSGRPNSIANTFGPPKLCRPLKVAILGHPYILNPLTF